MNTKNNLYIFLILLLFGCAHPTVSRIAIPIDRTQEINLQIDRLNLSPYLNEALCKHERNRQFILDELEKAKLPKELEAVSFLSTAFPREDHLKTTGLWNFSLFTAELYGLAVTDQVDERNNVTKETQAIIKNFKTLYSMFQDWSLTVLASHVGEGNVILKIRELQTNNAWIIEKALNPQSTYLTRFFAATRVLKEKNCNLK